MTRNPRLEAFLRARYEYDTCEPEFKMRCQANLFALATDLAGVYRHNLGQAITIEELLQITSEAYHEYRRAQVRLQQSRINRTR
jgi:hypothetical protein